MAKMPQNQALPHNPGQLGNNSSISMKYARPGGGILVDSDIMQLWQSGIITAPIPLHEKQLQPASLDLRLARRAYRVPASFIPGRYCLMADKLRDLALYELDLTQDTVLERDCIYIIELLEELALPDHIAAYANPKSSTGRLNIFTRLLYDYAEQFDKVPNGYKGKLYLELCPQSFPIKLRYGSLLTQLRFSQGQARVDEQALKNLQKDFQLISPDQPGSFCGANINLSIDLTGDSTGLIGYRAKRQTPVLDIDKIGQALITDFWEPLYHSAPFGLILDPYEFYIFCSKESIFIPPLFAAEMEPFVAEMGEFRVHYAGFFDPGFGTRQEGAKGSKAVLEVRSRDLPFIVHDGQIIGRLALEYLLHKPDKLYGVAMQSSYQDQGLKLSKHFRA